MEILGIKQMIKAIGEAITTIKQDCRKNLEHPQERKEFKYAKEAAALKKSTLSHLNTLSKNKVFSVSIATYLKKLCYQLAIFFGFKRYETFFTRTEQQIAYKEQLQKQLRNINKKEPSSRSYFVFSVI